MLEDLEGFLKSWPYDPTDERENVRLIVGAGGAEKIQLRIRFGVLQLFADGAPEGGGESGLDEVRRELAEHRARKGSEKGFSINAMRTAQLSQEMMDYYQRRVCCFILGDYRRAMRDAEHNLELMDLLSKHSVDEETAAGHERYRPFVTMDRARAAAMLAADRDDVDRAVWDIDAAVGEIRRFYSEHGREDLLERSKEIEVLEELKKDLREEHNVPPSRGERIEQLRQQQARAIAREDYEAAARLRDEIEKLRQQ